MPTTPQPNQRPLSPAVRYYLLLGEWPPVSTARPHRCVGWVELASDWSRDPSAARKAAAAFADELDEEAGECDFVPWYRTGRQPRCKGAARWREAFEANLANWY